jgi:signal transduction histidine kinase
MNSIRRQLLIWQISALILTGLLVSVVTYSLAWNGFNRIRDYGLEQIAYTVLRHGVEYNDETEELFEDHGQFASQIWNGNGSLFYSSMESGGPPRQAPGLHVLRWNGDEWHVFTLNQAGLTIQVANTTANRNVMFARNVPWLLIPMSILVTLLGVLIWTAVGRALAPMDRVRREISQRDALSLSALDVQDLPEEVAPMVEALNELLARLDTALTAQRRFVAEAAHELRTPLTAIKLQSQIAQRSPAQEGRHKALTELEAGVERASHLVSQLLQMARLEPEGVKSKPVPVRLDELMKTVVGDFSTQAESRRIDLGITNATPTGIIGRPESLRIMLNNLVDNALRYIPAGARVDLALVEREGQTTLTIMDNGPGIPREERKTVFERFHRLAGAEVPGSGLGLAIVAQVVAQHHAEISLDDTPGGGLTVRIVFPTSYPARQA